ncbi:MAG TPA: hypothetical protein VGE77_04495 [Nocardioides sp.]
MTHAASLPPLPPRQPQPLGPEGPTGPTDGPTGGSGRRGWFVAAFCALAVVLLGVVAVRVVAGFASGANSPEEAVEAFLEGAASDDGVASLAALSPGEVRGADVFYEAVEQRLAALELDTAALGGEGLVASIEGLDLSTEQLADGVARVTVEDGTFVIEREDGEPIDVAETFGPLAMFAGLGMFGAMTMEESSDVYTWSAEEEGGDVVVDDSGDVDTTYDDEPELQDRIEVPLAELWGYAATPFTWEYDEEGSSDLPDVDTSFLVVQHDDRWHVSILGTVADVVAQVSDAGDPDFEALAAALDAAENGDRAVGATPDDAIRLLVESFGDGSVTDVLDTLPVDLVGGLYPFASTLQDLADDEELALDLEVTELETTQVSDANGLVRVRVERLAAEGTASDAYGSEDVDLLLDGSCLTVDGDEECLPDEFVDATTLDSLVLTLVEVEGGYQVDPLATLYDNLATVAAELPAAYLAQFMGPATFGERTPVSTGTTTVTFDEAGSALLEIPAAAGDVLSVAVDADIDTIDFYAPSELMIPDYENTAVYGVWDDRADGALSVGATTVVEDGSQLVHLQLSDGGSTSLPVTVNVGAVPTVAVGATVELQYGTYGVATFAASEDGEILPSGPGEISYCWGTPSCTDLVVAAGPGVVLELEEYGGEYEEDYSDYRDDSAYDLPRAEAVLEGADDEAYLETSLVDGELSVQLDVATQGWVLLDVVNYIEDGDIVVEVDDADGAEVGYADDWLEYEDEWLDLELDPGTYTIVVSLYDGGDPAGDIDLFLN